MFLHFYLLIKSKEEIVLIKVLNDSNTRHQVKDNVYDYVVDVEMCLGLKNYQNNRKLFKTINHFSKPWNIFLNLLSTRS